MARLKWANDKEMHYSDLAGWLWCHRKFYFNKMSGVEEDDEGNKLFVQDFRSLPMVRGIAIHKAIEFYHQVCEEHNEILIPDFDMADQLMEAGWQHAVNEREEPVYFKEEGQTAENYLDFVVNPEAKVIRTSRDEMRDMICNYVMHTPADMGPVIATEVRFDVYINDQKYSGQIDQLREYRGGIAIVDLKSGKSQVPEPFILRYGNQFSLYNLGLLKGSMRVSEEYSHAEQKVVVAGIPLDIQQQLATKTFWVNLNDFNPYLKKTGKDPHGKNTHPETTAWLLNSGWEQNLKSGKIDVPAGEFRGPGWYGTDRTEEELDMFETDARRIVQGIKMNIFPRNVSKMSCPGCEFRSSCLQEVSGETGKISDIAKDLRKDGAI